MLVSEHSDSAESRELDDESRLHWASGHALTTDRAADAAVSKGGWLL